MLRLIKSECKKLFKQRLALILFLLFTCYIVFSTFQIYHPTQTTGIPFPEAYQTMEGKAVSGLSMLQYQDKVLHSYAGKLDDAKIDTMQKDLNKILDNFPRGKVDEALMKSLFGNDYKEVLQHAKEGTITQEEIEKMLSITHGYSQDPDGRIDFQLPILHENDLVRILYLEIYTNRGAYLYDQKSIHLNDLEFNYPITGKQAYVDRFIIPSLSSNAIQKNVVLKEWMQDKFEQNSTSFDSVMPNNLFLTALYKINFIPLLIIVIVLANMFAMEKTHKTDQILIPSKAGAKKITIAKIITGSIYGLGILWVQIMIIAIMSLLYLPIHTLDLNTFSQAGTSLMNTIDAIFTYKEMIMCIILLMNTAVFATCIMTMGFSYLTKQRFATVIILLVFVLITGAVPFYNFIQTTLPINAFMPSQMMQFFQFFDFNENFQPYFTIGSDVIAWKNIIIIFWIAVSCLLIFGMYLRSKKHIVKSR